MITKGDWPAGDAHGWTCRSVADLNEQLSELSARLLKAEPALTRAPELCGSASVAAAPSTHCDAAVTLPSKGGSGQSAFPCYPASLPQWIPAAMRRSAAQPDLPALSTDADRAPANNSVLLVDAMTAADSSRTPQAQLTDASRVFESSLWSWLPRNAHAARARAIQVCPRLPGGWVEGTSCCKFWTD